MVSSLSCDHVHIFILNEVYYFPSLLLPKAMGNMTVTGDALTDVLQFFQVRRDALLSSNGRDGNATLEDLTYWRDAQIAASAITGQVTDIYINHRTHTIDHSS